MRHNIYVAAKRIFHFSVSLSPFGLLSFLGLGWIKIITDFKNNKHNTLCEVEFPADTQQEERATPMTTHSQRRLRLKCVKTNLFFEKQKKKKISLVQ